MNKTRNEVDMLNGPLASKIFFFALPLAVSAMLQQLFNAADLAVVGQFVDPIAMAAVGSNASVISLLVSLFTGLSIGSNVVVGNIIGAGKRDRINIAVHTTISVAIISGIFLTCVGILAAKPILVLMGAPEEVRKLAVLYLRIYFCGMPAAMLYNFGSAILRAKGDSKRPVLALIEGGVMNVVLNIVFVVGLHLSVVGVAAATVISNCFSAAVVLRCLFHEDDEFRLDLSKLSVQKDILIKIILIGAPAGLQGMVFSISNVVIQSAVNSFGANCIAGMTAGQNFDFISYCLINAFGQTCVTFTAQNYGAGNAERCSRVWKLSMLMGIALDSFLIAVLMIFRYNLIRLFTNNPEVIQYAMIRIFYSFTAHFLVVTYEVTGGALRGMNRSLIPALISILGTCGVRLMYVLFIFPKIGTPQALISVYPLTWIITGILMNIAYFLIKNKAFSK